MNTSQCSLKQHFDPYSRVYKSQHGKDKKKIDKFLFTKIHAVTKTGNSYWELKLAILKS